MASGMETGQVICSMVHCFGANEPAGFILTTVLGIVGAFVATYFGQAPGWYRPGEGTGLIGAVVDAVIVLLVYGFVVGRQRRTM
ncbi:putative membrane protein YeaQ/YmgE (transglycosylase-associated protein family) [Bradyrhizobium japonicum]